MDKNENMPQGFTLSLALTDALPVLFFGAGVATVYQAFKSPLFLAGGLICVLAGCGKVTWKLLIALAKKDVRPLSLQLRYLMPLGFGLMIASLMADKRLVDLAAVWRAVTGFPSVLFFAVGALGMAAMGVFANKLDGGDARVNWVEECTNLVAQASFLAGLLFAVH